MAIPTTNVSFSSIYNAINDPDHNGSDAISLSSFRGQTFTSGDPVPASGAISIDTDFRGRTPGGNPIPDGTYELLPRKLDNIRKLPVYGLYDFSQGGFIYLKEEIEAATGTVDRPGTLMGICFDYNGWSSGYRVRNQKIKISHVQESELPSPGFPDYRGLTLSDTTLVKGNTGSGFTKNFYNSPQPPFGNYGGVLEFDDFEVGFEYNGQDNILISWENREGDWEFGYGWIEGDTDFQNRANSWARDNSYPTLSSTTDAGRPNIKFKFITQ